MNSYYTLVKFSTNELSDDNLTVGIIFANSSSIRMELSKHRIKQFKKLSSFDNDLIDFVLSQLNNFIDEQKRILNWGDDILLFKNEGIAAFSNFDYLHRYSNGLLRFSEPKLFSKEINDDSVKKLYSAYFEEKCSPISIKENKGNVDFYNNIKIKLIDKVESKVHTNQKLDGKIVPTLLLPFTVDCIGLNGAFVGAKAVPFTQSDEALQKNINTYCSIIFHLKQTYKKEGLDNNFFLISDEPKQGTNAHAFWKQLKDQETLFKIIPSNEVEQVSEIIFKKDAKEFLNS